VLPTLQHGPSNTGDKLRGARSRTLVHGGSPTAVPADYRAAPRHQSPLVSFIALLCGVSSKETPIWVVVDLRHEFKKIAAGGASFVGVPLEVCTLPEKAPLASAPCELELGNS
jgi:hypothetical protein